MIIYYHISLLRWIQKLVARVLAAKLRNVLGDLVWDTQTTFLQGRNIIADGWEVASEVVSAMKRKEEGVIFMVYFEKAYDCVEMDFIWFILEKMGFGTRWIRWMKRCVFFVWVSVLVNGYTRGKFSMQRGLRKGCPLSSMLFNIVAEALTILLNQFKENGWLQRLKV